MPVQRPLCSQPLVVSVVVVVALVVACSTVQPAVCIEMNSRVLDWTVGSLVETPYRVAAGTTPPTPHGASTGTVVPYSREATTTAGLQPVDGGLGRLAWTAVDGIGPLTVYTARLVARTTPTSSTPVIPPTGARPRLVIGLLTSDDPLDVRGLQAWAEVTMPTAEQSDDSNMTHSELLAATVHTATLATMEVHSATALLRKEDGWCDIYVSFTVHAHSAALAIGLSDVQGVTGVTVGYLAFTPGGLHTLAAVHNLTCSAHTPPPL